jgi:WD40 repeat protein
LVKIIQLWPNNVGFTLDLKHKGDVNTAFFNSSGDLVLTASSDTSAVVWIANTGAKKFELMGHHKPVHWAVFDPKDEFIATASSDSLVIIWSQVDGAILKIIDDHTSKVESVNFSKSGNYFVSSDFAGYSVIRDRNWNVLKRVKSNDVGPSWYTDFNPVNEDFILSANGDGKAKEWNWRNYTPGSNPEKIFDTKSIMCSHATYNTDATKVSATTSSGNPKKLYVWDVNNLANPLYEISHNNDTIDNNSINFSSFFFHTDLNKEVLLTTSTDETARLWDAGDGSPARINDFITDNIFREHRNSVTTAVFDRFGTRLLTASWDSTAKIWNLNQKELQQDVSDSVFSIAYARGKGLTIDMGTVFLGELKDSIVRAVFINESKFAYHINSFSFSGANAEDYEILTDLELPYLINAMDSLPLEIRFYPKSTGLRTAQLEFSLPAGVIVKSEIQGFCDLPDLKLNYPLVDFDKIDVGSYKDSTFTMIMTNQSGASVDIENIVIGGSYYSEFTSVQNIGKTIQNGESIPVTLRFLPESIGRKNALYQVNYKGKGSPREVNLFGEGTNARNDSVMIYVKNAEAFPGDIIKVPIYIGSVGEIGISDLVEGFTTNMKFNATLLEPLNGFRTSEIIGDERHLTIDLPKTFAQDSILHVLEFKALWGNDTISPLILEYTVPRGSGRIAITENSANFKLNGVCLQDGELRLFSTGNILSLGQNNPNPVSDKTSITFSIFETGNSKIILNDVLGNHIKTLFDGTLPLGEHTINPDLSDIAQGIYYYSLITPSNVIYKTMVITR